MSTNIVGFRPTDAKWKAMKAIWESCEANGISIPPEVNTFFGGEAPGDKPGMEIDIENSAAVKPYRAEMSEGFEIDVTKLPPDVRMIRVFNSY